MTTQHPTPTSTMTLAEALEHTYRTRWAHARDGGRCLYSQADQAVKGLNALHFVYGRGTVPRVNDIEPADVNAVTSQWYAQGLSPATITKRLNCLSAMGVSVSGMRPPKERNLKWWLRPEEETQAVVWLRRFPDGPNRMRSRLADHIEWTTKTGLRVEETLRLTIKDFGPDFTTVTVPGTKTASSQATLPLGSIAQEAGERIMGWPTPTTYGDLEAAWRQLREAMGWPQAATLKALRRSAARYLHVDCGMPLDLVRAYLRHENINTTLSYLRLVGGYNVDEMRRYLR